MKNLCLEGLNYKEFIHRTSIMDTGDFHAIEEMIDLSQKVINRVKEIKKIKYILAFAEGWCIDCKINLPVLNELITYNTRIDLCIIPKEGNEKYLSNYKEDGKVKIPTFIFMDENFTEVAHWIEAPIIVKELRKNEDPRHDLYLTGQMLQDSIEELVAVMEKEESSC